MFFSHSWRDEDTAPGAKFYQLMAWAADFYEKELKKPCLWLDKACIAQDDIDSELACLPVFLAGCRVLFICAGPTYTGRLWCVMECFAFLAIKGIDSANARPLTRCCYAGGGGTALEGFRLLKAQCSNVHQRQLLMGIIERSYPDLSEFNEAIKRLLDADDDDDELRPLAERTIALTEDGETVTGDARV